VYRTARCSPANSWPSSSSYWRHGTQTLIAAIQVATGIVHGLAGDTRTEVDFAHFIEAVIQLNPGYRAYHFLLDQLNTHKSKTLIRTTARLCELGVKGPSAILQSMDTRETFLSLPNKRGVFHCPLKHASWINQIEIWFGILAKKVVKQGRFVANEKLLVKSPNRSLSLSKCAVW